MKTLIYQYWDGDMTPGNAAGSRLMKEYANRIGSNYIFEHNPRWQKNLGPYSPHYGAFKPIFDEEMQGYDYVLFADTDVIPVDKLSENIFEYFDDQEGDSYDIGICEEHLASRTRLKTKFHINNTNDERWYKVIESKYRCKLRRDAHGLPMVINSGVVVYSSFGMQKFRERHLHFREYQQLMVKHRFPIFYQCDQPYLQFMVEYCDLDCKIMDYRWNSSVHYKPDTKGDNRPVNDFRFDRANFVHIQLRGADHFDFDKTKRVANQPVNEW